MKKVCLFLICYLSASVVMFDSVCFSCDTGYRITNTVLNQLKEDKIPQNIIDSLQPLKDTLFENEGNYKKIIGEAVGKESENYIKKISEYSKFDSPRKGWQFNVQLGYDISTYSGYSDSDNTDATTEDTKAFSGGNLLVGISMSQPILENKIIIKEELRFGGTNVEEEIANNTFKIIKDANTVDFQLSIEWYFLNFDTTSTYFKILGGGSFIREKDINDDFNIQNLQALQ